MNYGWIYVFMTSSNYRCYKVGRTKNNPMLRLNQLKIGDPLIGLAVAYLVPESSEKLSTIEAMIHKQLGTPISFHNEKSSEWFTGESSNAWIVLDTIFESLGYEVTDYFHSDGNKVVRFWEENLISFYAPSPKLSEDSLPW